jgi:hypothetical protein
MPSFLKELHDKNNIYFFLKIIGSHIEHYVGETLLKGIIYSSMQNKMY